MAALPVTQQLSFKPAEKSESLLRLAIFGPSGAGKTKSALRLANGLAQAIEGKIGALDTERGSMKKYADEFHFDVLELEDRTVAGYTKALILAAQMGYQVLVVDSLTHAWKELLQKVDKLAQQKYGGNTWAAWSEGTPEQNDFIDALLRFPGHIVVTMRSKTEWQIEEDERGKKRPVRIGLAPEQGKGIEYEFDMLIELSANHTANVIKDRTGIFQDQRIELITEELGAQLAGWLQKGVPLPPPPLPWNEAQVETILINTEIEDADKARAFLDRTGLHREVTVEIVEKFARLYAEKREAGEEKGVAFEFAKEHWENG